jgi:large subunit ribosomal protein L4
MTATATTPTPTSPTGERTGTVLKHAVKKDRPAPVARTAPRRNAAGHDLGTVDLEPAVFGHTPNRALLHQVVTAQLAAIRAGTQSTRTRAEVRGGGAKPFRQKGTGRARQGSSRSPSMVGGGVALGPKPRSYAQQTPKKMIRLALLSALSDRADIGRIVVLEDWEIDEPDTRAAATILRKLKLDGSVLAVLAQDEINVALSLRNLPEASITTFAELSAHDVIRADWLLFSDRTVPTAVDDFSGTHDRVAPPAPTPRAKKPKAEPVADADAGAEAEEDETPAKAATSTKAAKATKATKATKSAATKAAKATKASAATKAAKTTKASKTAKSTKSTKATEATNSTKVAEAAGDDDTQSGSEEADADA